MQKARVLPALVQLAEATAGRASLSLLKYETLKDGIKVELQGKTENLAGYLRSLESKGAVLLEEAAFNKEGAEIRLTFRGARR